MAIGILILKVTPLLILKVSTINDLQIGIYVTGDVMKGGMELINMLKSKSTTSEAKTWLSNGLNEHSLLNDRLP